MQSAKVEDLVQSYLQSFDQPIRKPKEKKSVVQPPVHYYGGLENPQVYFGAVCAGAVVYYFDLHYNLIERSLFKVPCFCRCAINTVLSHTQVVINWPLEQQVLFIVLVLAVIQFVVAWHWSSEFKLKWAQEQNSEPPEECVANDLSEKPSWKSRKPIQSVTQISPGHFEWQSTVYTRQKIQELVNSETYKKFMAEKESQELAESNWKTKEIESGKLPPDEDTMIKNPIDLGAELDKVD